MSDRTRGLLSFAIVALVWGSTWLVIRDQIATVPVGWSVTWRFLVAAAGMFALAAWRREPLALNARGLAYAAAIGIPQFTMNFQLVYRAEHHLTSGIVAVLFALLVLPNAVAARIFLKQPITRGFVIGTGIAIAGIALLLLHEYRAAPVGALASVPLGIALTIGAILCASTANVVQATEGVRRFPILTLLAWAMLIGAICDAVAAWVMSGPPQVEWRWGYFAGTFYLAIIGSVLTFPLYFNLIRTLGPGRAAYTSVVIPVIAMLLSTLFEGYRWSLLSACGGVLAMLGLFVAMRARNPVRQSG